MIKLIQEIKCSPKQPIDRLIHNLGISKAQFYKDKKSLAELEFEFRYSRPLGRFVVTKDAFLPVEDLSISERLSLVMAVRQLSAAGDYLLSFEGLNAARKLTADLPGPLRDSTHVLFDDLVLKQGFGCDRKILERLQTAIGESRRVVLDYLRPESDKPTPEELDPYHLFFKRRALYVEGYSWTEKGIRMYRVNRIKAVRFTPMQFTVRQDYDFARRHKNAFSAFPGEQTEKVAVRFSPKVRPYIEESLWHYSQVISKEKDGTIRFEVDVAEPREVMWWAFQWGAEAEILEPGWLREEAKREMIKMSKRYD
ncbi:MAG: WYL domain-containing protein [Deltaproteobacteria bacterium]|nr:WYL domain-containing protein [Deltaproteobacteria bacterium]